MGKGAHSLGGGRWLGIGNLDVANSELLIC